MEISVKNSSVIIGLFLVTMLGCSKDDNPVDLGDNDFVYPLTVGNKWEYSRAFSIFNFRSDSTDSTPGDTIFATSSIEIVRTDTLLDSIECFVLQEVFTEQEDTFVDESYYSNEEDGLYHWAYNGAGYAIPKTIAGKRIYFKGRYFSSVREISRFVERAIAKRIVMSDSIYYEDPPLQSLAYPLSDGLQWTYAGNPWRHDKKVVGEENVTVAAGTFRCYKIQRLIDLDDNGEWDDDIEFYDYMSSQGLIERDALFKDMIWVNERGLGLGIFDSRDKYELTGLNLK